MVVKTTITVVSILIALVLLAFGILAALGISINLDFSSPGPIVLPDRPALEKTPTDQSEDSSFKFKE
jgi:hypothetical protein